MLMVFLFLKMIHIVIENTSRMNVKIFAPRVIVNIALMKKIKWVTINRKMYLLMALSTRRPALSI